MIPYDSFLIDPFLLMAFGLIIRWASGFVATTAKARFTTIVSVFVMACFWFTSVSLYFDLEWSRWIWELCGAASGRDWMVNSGVFHFDWRHLSTGAHVLATLIFLSYPAWLVIGLKLRKDGGVLPQLPRWRGQAGRIETWYATFTDSARGDGYWLHGERVSPAKKGQAAFVRGWVARFPSDGSEPRCEHFGPEPQIVSRDGGALLHARSAHFDADILTGKTKGFSWQLHLRHEGAPLYTFPRWIWENEFLPGCQAVPSPQTVFSGTIRDGDTVIALDGARGAYGHVYARSHAVRWAWLHADLADGVVIEVVAALGKSFFLNALGPLVFLRLRQNGVDWPRRPLCAALFGFKAEISDENQWSVSGRAQGRFIRVDVKLPSERCLVMDYEDPAGLKTKCRNSERATACVTIETAKDGALASESWELDGLAHAEIGWRVT